MDRRQMEDSCKKFCTVLEYLNDKNDWSAADTEWAKNAISGIEKLMKLGYEDEYSQRRYSREGSSNRGSSYDDGGGSYGHYVRGHYSREGDGGSSMRGYSRDPGSMAEHISRLMREANTEREKEILSQALDKLER